MSDGRLRVLDTDTLSLVQRGREPVVRRLLGTPVGQRSITIITVEEQLRGRLADIHRAIERTPQFVAAYKRLQQSLDAFQTIWVLPLDADGARSLATLRERRIRLGTQDIRIAAITLAVGGILVTCNTAHLEQVPGLFLLCEPLRPLR